MKKREEDLKKIMLEEFREVEKSFRHLFILLVLFIIAAIIAAALFFTNLVGAIDSVKSAQNNGQNTSAAAEASGKSHLISPSDFARFES